jgi:ribosomal peptide maturation radical SAM protein 1
VRSFACVDSILDMAYFDDLLPRLRDSALGLRLFYEVKANLSRRQLNLLADAGITLLQPGLEHLSSRVLGLMRKGTTFLQNAQFLKWSRERNLTVFWAILYGFPGETFDSYEAIARQIPALYHLFPPKAAVRVRVDRFSPLFMTPQALGLASVSPARTYRHVYPFDEPVLRRLAYHFEGEYAARDPSLNDRIREAIVEPIAEWNERYFRHGAVLDYIVGRRRVLVRDTRGSMPGLYIVLDGLPARILMACDAHTSRQHLERVAAQDPSLDKLTENLSQASASDDAMLDGALQQAERMRIPIVRPGADANATLDAAIAWLAEHALLIGEGERYLNLACSVSTPARWLDRGRADANELLNIAATRKVVLEGVA